jgi:hypothetical protein
MDHDTDEATQREMTGRRMLWLDSLYECRKLLVQAQKAEVAAMAAEERRNREAQSQAFSAYVEKIATDDSRVHKTIVYEEFVDRHPDLFPFPQPGDLLDMARNNRKLAAVAFMRIWNAGFQDSGKVAGNLSATINKLRHSIVVQALPSEGERAAFEALLLQLRAARDGMIAHSDGAAAEAHHEPGFSRVKTSALALEGVDVSHWRRVAESLWGVLSTMS